MDVKSSARAKRASSQRGRARHSTRKQPQQREKQQHAVSDLQEHDAKEDWELPSNWSRYEEEEEEGEEGEAAKNNRVSVPSVKSKGANYRDLLAEKSMLQASDLATGRKGLMLTHGRDLWSRFRDTDNLWSINEGSREEESFFALDLDFICEELAKLDMAERLLLDPEYACDEVSCSVNKMSEAETVDELSGRSSFIGSSSSAVSLLDIKDGNKSTSAGNTKAVEGHSANIKLLAKGGVSSEQNGNDSGTFPNTQLEIPAIDFHPKVEKGHAVDTKGSGKTGASEWNENYLDRLYSTQLEIPDCDMRSFFQDPLVPLPKATSLFDVKSAEADLDALLDMLDNKAPGQGSSVMSMESLGLASGPSPVALKGLNPEVFQPRNALNFHDATMGMPNGGASNGSPFYKMGLTNVQVKSTTDVGTRSSVSNLALNFHADNTADATIGMLNVRASNESPFHKIGLTSVQVKSTTDVGTSRSVSNLALNLHVDNTADATIGMPNVRASNESSFCKMGLTNVQVKSTTDVSTNRSVCNLEDDFDKWLDSL